MQQTGLQLLLLVFGVKVCEEAKNFDEYDQGAVIAMQHWQQKSLPTRSTWAWKVI